VVKKSIISAMKYLAMTRPDKYKLEIKGNNFALYERLEFHNSEGDGGSYWQILQEASW